MARYIDADDVLTQKKPLEWQNSYEQGKVIGWNNAIDYIANFASTADVRENVKGEWKILDKHTVQCPVCNNTLDLSGVNAGRGDANYCPNCGADMRGEVK